MCKSSLLLCVFVYSAFAFQLEQPSRSKSVIADRHQSGLAEAGCSIQLLGPAEPHFVDQTYEFASGDRVRLMCSVHTKSFVYVLNQTFVRNELGESVPTAVHLVSGPEKMESGSSRQIPDEFPMKFVDPVGTEELKIIFSPRRLPALESQFDMTARERKLISDERHDDTNQSAISNLNELSYDKNTIVQRPYANSKGLVPDRADPRIIARPKQSEKPMELTITLMHPR